MKENTFVERKAKENPFEIRQETRKTDSRRLGQLTTFYLQVSVLNIFSSTLTKKRYRMGYDIVWGSQECDFPSAFQVKCEVKCEGNVVAWHDG